MDGLCEPLCRRDWSSKDPGGGGDTPYNGLYGEAPGESRDFTS